MGGEYKKYVPVKPEGEAKRFKEKTDEYYAFFKKNVAFENFYLKVRSMAPLKEEERKESFEKFRKSHYDHQPLLSAETHEKFFKDVLPDFKIIKDPAEMQKRQEIHDAAWDVFETYANEYVKRDFPYAYPNGTDRFAQSLFGVLPDKADKEELYKLLQIKGDPLNADPQTKAAYEKLVVKSVDYMLSLTDEIKEISSLDDEQFVKEIAPYLAVIMHMSAADDSLKAGDAFKDCDPEKIEQIKSLNTVAVRVMAKMQRMLDMHYPAYSYKNTEDMSLTELIKAKAGTGYKLESMTVDGISGFSAGLSEFNSLALAVDLAYTQRVTDVTALIEKAVGCEEHKLGSTYHFVDMAGNEIADDIEAAAALDRGELIYALTKLDYKKGIEEPKIVPIYCAGDIMHGTIYTGDDALVKPQTYHKHNIPDAKEEMRKYDEQHPEPKLKGWDKFVAGFVNFISFGTRASAAEIECDKAHAEWESSRKKAKEDFEKKQEMHKIFMGAAIPDKSKAKLAELEAKEIEQYKKDEARDIENKQDKAIADFLKDTFDVEKTIDDLKTASDPKNPDPAEAERCLAKILCANDLEFDMEKLKTGEDFYLDLAELRDSYDLKEDMQSTMRSPSFISFRNHYDYELDGSSRNNIRDAYYNSIKLYEKLDALSKDKRTPAEQKADREAMIKSALKEDVVISKLQNAYKKGNGAEIAKYAARLIITNNVHKLLAESIDKPEFCDKFREAYDSEEFMQQFEDKKLEEFANSAEFKKFFSEYDFSKIESIKDISGVEKLAADYQKLGLEGAKKDIVDKYVQKLDIDTPAKKLQVISLSHNPEKLKQTKDIAAEIIVKANIKNKLEAAVAGGSSEADFKAIIESFDLQQQLRTLKESPEFGEFVGKINFSDPKTVKILSDPDKMLESFIMGSAPAPVQNVQTPVNTNEKKEPQPAKVENNNLVM